MSMMDIAARTPFSSVEIAVSQHYKDAPNILARAAALIAGGSLLASAVAIFTISGQYPNPEHQVIGATATLLLGLVVGAAALGLGATNRYLDLSVFGLLLLLVLALPLLRFIPAVYTNVYEQDLESLFPPFWVFSLSIPLMVMVVAELALSGRKRTFSAALLVAAVVPASLLLFYSSVIVDIMSSFAFVTLPSRTLYAYSACVGLSSLLIVGAGMTTRGLAVLGILILVATGLFLQIGSIYFYDGISRYWTFSKIWLPYSFWVPFFAGTVPGAMAILIALARIVFTGSTDQTGHEERVSADIAADPDTTMFQRKDIS